MPTEFSSLLAVLTPIALFDSTSITPLCIVPLAILLGGDRPLVKSTAFLSGILLTYLVSSLAILFGLQSVFTQLNELLSEKLRNPDSLDLALQGVIGAAMVFFGARMADARESDDDRGLHESVTPGRAFGIGAVMTIVGMPGAFPLFAAVDQILRADLGTTDMVMAMVIYNAIFMAPLSLVVVLRIWLGERSEPILERVNAFVATWGHRVVVWGLVILGTILVLDAIGWSLGYPLLPTFE